MPFCPFECAGPGFSSPNGAIWFRAALLMTTRQAPLSAGLRWRPCSFPNALMLEVKPFSVGTRTLSVLRAGRSTDRPRQPFPTHTRAEGRSGDERQPGGGQGRPRSSAKRPARAQGAGGGRPHHCPRTDSQAPGGRTKRDQIGLVLSPHTAPAMNSGSAVLVNDISRSASPRVSWPSRRSLAVRTEPIG